MRAAAMSDIVERTLTALPGLFLQSPPGSGPAAAKAPFSSRLGGLVRGVTALTSKHVGAGRRGRRRGGRGRAGRAGPGEGSLPSVWLEASSCLDSPKKAGFPPSSSDLEQFFFSLTPLCVSQRSGGRGLPQISSLLWTHTRLQACGSTQCTEVAGVAHLQFLVPLSSFPWVPPRAG